MAGGSVMKVTFAVYDHATNAIDLIKSEVKGNKPSEEEWEQAAIAAKKKASEMAGKEWDDWRNGIFNAFSVAYVLKGWVDFEERAPAGLQ
jgi:hypothetical protein